MTAPIDLCYGVGTSFCHADLNKLLQIFATPKRFGIIHGRQVELLI
jgi:hypothetical protein